MAASTWEILSDLLTQLEPLATAIPFKSQSRSCPSPSMNSVEMLRFVGMRSGPGRGPLSLMYGMRDARPSHKRFWSAAAWAMRPGSFLTATSAATPAPTMAGMFSVPARRPPSCTPPWMIETNRAFLLRYRTPTPLGP